MISVTSKAGWAGALQPEAIFISRLTKKPDFFLLKQTALIRVLLGDARHSRGGKGRGAHAYKKT